jgi:hypothetical protein
MGARLPPRGGSLHPLAQSRGGGGRDDAWGGRRNARRQATYEGGDAHREGAGTRRGDGRGLLTVKFRQPSHEFTFGVGMTFVSYSLVLTPVV